MPWFVKQKTLEETQTKIDSLEHDLANANQRVASLETEISILREKFNESKKLATQYEKSMQIDRATLEQVRASSVRELARVNEEHNTRHRTREEKHAASLEAAEKAHAAIQGDLLVETTLGSKLRAEHATAQQDALRSRAERDEMEAMQRAMRRETEERIAAIMAAYKSELGKLTRELAGYKN